MKIMSFNCKHFYDPGLKFDFINKYISDCDFLFLQEHYLYKSQFCDMALLGGGMGSKLKVPWMKLYLRKGGSMGVVPYCGNLMSKEK